MLYGKISKNWQIIILLLGILLLQLLQYLLIINKYLFFHLFFSKYFFLKLILDQFLYKIKLI